ncbi:effector-associated constant component EACC1 [Streptomyces anandii]|uniref:effector-associated constant component EACC1 n=1 Tax=Streptomyces anandii TaxID=285454 RepID=UPI0037937C62
MDVTVAAQGPDSGDQLRSLGQWLRNDQELRGRVGDREAPVAPGALGPVLDALEVALGPGGAATAFATGVIAWLRSRRGEVRIKVTLPGRRSLELTARRVAGLDAEALRRQVAELADLVNQGQDGADGDTGADDSGGDTVDGSGGRRELT